MIDARPARIGRALRFVGLFVPLLLVLGASGDAAACACCADAGHWSQATRTLSVDERALLARVVLGPEAALHVGAAGLEQSVTPAGRFRGSRFQLILQASGNACSEVSQLTGWILRISGTGAPYALVSSAAVMPLYFSSPEDAVTVATELMRRDDWPTLARYYDLSRSKIPREALTSGRFFVRTNPPATAHPGLPWRYRHPFTPGFTFKEASAVAEVGVVLVVVGIEIDEGGGRVRRGFSEFKLRQSSAGYQILPPQEGSSLE